MPFKKTRRSILVSAMIGIGVNLVLCLKPVAPEPVQTETAAIKQAVIVPEPIQPLTLPNLDPRKVMLGKRLFQDPGLSADNTISCESCHGLRTGGTDRRPHSVGIHHLEGKRNSPTVFNCSLNYRQFWDGRAASLEAQMEAALLAKGMGSSWADVLHKLKASNGYVREFHAIYPNGIQARNVEDAIATFERSLITPDCRFDRFLRGEPDSITPHERAGYALFKSYGCISCHQGINVGGNLMQPFGVIVDPAVIRRKALQKDLRYFQLTDIEADSTAATHAMYKVPSLRNVAVTAPYFHDGSARTLEDAVALMGYSQLGRHLSAQELETLVAFLKTLTGRYQGRPL